MKHYLLVFLTVWVLIGTAAIVYFQQVDGTLTNPAITFNVDTHTLDTDKPAYRPGEMVSVKFSYCRHRSFAATSQWKIVNEFEVSYATSNYVLQPECVTDKFYPIGIVPSDAVKGIHRLKGTTDAMVNPI